MGVIGAGTLIGGRAGLGLMKSYLWRGTRYGAGKARGVVNAPMRRGHAALKEKSKWYRDKTEGISKTLKHSPIGGRMVIKLGAEKAEKLKGEVSKHEKVMEKLTDKDKKAYVDSFKVDMKARAAAQQAMFNLLAKDSGKGLTNTRLQKAGYEKDKLDADGNVVKDADGNNVKEFDRERFMKDYGKVSAFGHNTTNVEKYRPDLIRSKDDKIDRVKKIVADGDQNKIKSSALLDNDVAKALIGEIGEVEYNKLLQNKPQEEKNEMVEAMENDLVKMMRRGASHSERIKQQEKIIKLASPEEKLDKMRHASIDLNGNIRYSGGVNIDLAKNSIRQMPNSEILKQSSGFFDEVGHLVSQSAIKEMGKYGQVEKVSRIENKIQTELAATGPGSGDLSPSGVTREKLEKRQKAAKNVL